MKKILFLLLICVIKLSAYEYEILFNTSNDRRLWYTDERGILEVRQYSKSTDTYQYSHIGTINYSWLYNIKMSSLTPEQVELEQYTQNYLGKVYFDEILKTDLKFLNDLYLTSNYSRGSILNYFYNNNNFGSSNYIDYNDYELLYNSDGLAVESIVNGHWAGLYNGPDQSGYLYDEKGDLKYINGVSPSFFESSFNKLMRRFGVNLQSVFIRQIFYPLLILIFACVVFRTVIRMAFKAFLIRFYDRNIDHLQKRREGIEDA